MPSELAAQPSEEIEAALARASSADDLQRQRVIADALASGTRGALAGPHSGPAILTGNARLSPKGRCGPASLRGCAVLGRASAAHGL